MKSPPVRFSCRAEKTADQQVTKRTTENTERKHTEEKSTTNPFFSVFSSSVTSVPLWFVFMDFAVDCPALGD
jgi:hypothetical protein